MRHYLLAGAAMAALGLSNSAQAQSAAKAARGVARSAPERPQEAASVTEVIVTASRRSVSVKNTPAAVTAISGDALKAGQFASLADLTGSIPNIQIATYNNNANIAIRGIGNGQINAGADAGVAVHQDGVYIGQSVLTLSTLYDIQRIEVLRGPQGTLFGRNATGGAVNIIPNPPTEELHYGVDAAFGVDPIMTRSSAYISGPIASQLLGRLSVQQNYNEGFTRNLQPITGKSAVPARLDDVDSKSIRAQLQAGTGDFITRVSLEYSKNGGAGPAQFDSGTPDGVLPAVLNGANFGNVRKREVYNNFGYNNDEAKFATVISTLKLAGGELKGTASYGDTNIVSLTDGDGTNVDHTSTFERNKANQTYGELIYTSDPSRPLSVVIGANYFHENLTQNIEVPISTLPPPFDTLGAVSVNLGGTIKSTSYAGFGQADYKITDAFRVFAGVRYTHDEKSIVGYNNFGSPQVASAGWSRATYDVGASYRFTSNITGYAKYGTGYKGGGFSAGADAPAFNPETNTNIEVGLKGNYLDGGLQANLATFHMSYNNLQVNQIVGALVAVTNAARATIDGVEAETVIRPVRQLHINLNASWLDARFDEFFTSDSSRPNYLPDTRVVNGVPTRGIELARNTLPEAPEFTVSVGAYYDIRISRGTVTVGGRYDWKDREYFSEFNVPIAAQKAIGKLNLSARYVSENGRWSASVFADNVTNEQVKSNVIVVSSLIGSLAVTRYAPARQIGISLGYKY